MAGLWGINLRIQITAYDITRINMLGNVYPTVFVEGKQVKGLSVYQATKTRYCRSTVSDISGYRKLLPTNISSATDYNRTTGAELVKPLITLLIEEFATDATDINGFNWNTESANNLKLRGNFYRAGTSLIPDIMRIRINYYHRDADGNETLLGSDTTTNFPSDESSETKYETFYPVTGQLFLKNERLVLKFYAQFQRGK